MDGSDGNSMVSIRGEDGTSQHTHEHEELDTDTFDGDPAPLPGDRQLGAVHQQYEATSDLSVTSPQTRTLQSTTSFSKALHVVQSEEFHRAVCRLRTAFIRGAAAGGVLRGGLHVFTRLLTVISSKKKGKRASLSVLQALLDTLQYAAAMGVMTGLYVVVDEGLAVSLGKNRTAGWRGLVAGAVAGQTLHLAGSQKRHYSLATYILLRGLALLIFCGNKQGANPLIRSILTPTRFEHGDVALMCASASQILYSFIMMPSTLPPSYIKFLNKHAGKELWVWKAVREQALRNSTGLPPTRLKSLSETRFCNHVARSPCGFWHPGQSCSSHTISYLPTTYARAIGVYVPVYLIPALLVHREKLIKKPMEIWPKVVAGIGRSSLFLTLYIAAAFGSVCGGINASGSVSGHGIASSVWLSGLATLVEKKSRRMELALYCASRAVEALSRCLIEWGVVDARLLPARLDVIIFSAACAAIMHCYSDKNGQNRDAFKSKYLNVLDFIFGNTGLEHGSIAHVPSNKQLLGLVKRRVRSYSWTKLHSAAEQYESRQQDKDLRRAKNTGSMVDVRSSLQPSASDRPPRTPLADSLLSSDAPQADSGVALENNTTATSSPDAFSMPLPPQDKDRGGRGEKGEKKSMLRPRSPQHKS